MSRSPILDEQMKEATRQKIMETALRVFSEKTIDAVNMAEIAKEAYVGQGTIYRLFDKKPDLVLSVGAWMWTQYRARNSRKVDTSGMTAAEVFEFYLESFIDLYRNHRDILRFNGLGYAMQEATAVDMFPRTRHVESVVLMSRPGS